ncbi:phosphoglucomutase [Sporocytophaga myxococcoides]|uniref:Phosphoglucomutase n=1 Tax=Sporocytophaga myxococcoides TaxID=153721 RepID=A0A098LDK6_9BACT|nr:phospho-sugar mutase [Sporocytophaga myxococcoides]GAL85025.1 phosphoglucomutase [Sporocytophaga myxococcoides]
MEGTLIESTKIDKATKDRINQWLNGNYDSQTKDEIKGLIKRGKEDELIDSFYKDLEFGTGGLRGIMGVGSNRMNKYTIGMATQGLSNYLKKSFPGEQLKVAVAHDSRNNSDYFAKITAEVFSANGIKVYFFKALRPTPELSFAVRLLGCHGGVVLTASHNPKEYNGYKAYWKDGAQMIAPHDKNTITEVQNIKDVSDIKFQRNDALIEIIGEEVDSKYLDMIHSLSISKDAIKRQKDLKIVFTPIHGTGIVLVPDVLKKFGFTNINVVEEQSKPDGNFPTVVYPNPEEPDALSLALKKAKEIDADILMGTDPDSDRVGIAVKNHKGEFQLLNGNQTGSLLLNYLINAWKDAGKIKGKEFIVKTIVTTYLIDKIAADNGVKCYNTLTGFKYIAALIGELEGKELFIGGGEESYGYLVGDQVRDKDAISSCAFIAEMAAYAKDKGVSLFDMMRDMYVKYGFYKEKLISLTKKGKSGAEEIQQMMKDLRNNPPKVVAGSALIQLKDYQAQTIKDLKTGKETPTNLPKENVLQFLTEDGTLVSARPSGTEPKIKFYISVNTPLSKKEDYDKVNIELDKKIENVINDMNLK